MALGHQFTFDNSYARLPERFYTPEGPRAVAAPALIRFNHALAVELGIDGEKFLKDGGLDILAGNASPQGGSPLAMAYAGHQFGNFVPQLGDGRASLVGEVVDANGTRRDIQLKGSGPTAFSRNGDGRSALGPVIREYIVSEAMHSMGIPTTRSLAIVATGENVFRENIQPGGVLTRVAASHLRIGTFQYFAARRDGEAIGQLVDYALKRHYPNRADEDNKALALLRSVIESQAALVSKWMQIGFIHGVMNTDNMSISGETIDYGPCAFMDHYDPAQVYSYIDRQGRYAFGNQPRIAQWNLARLAECLLEEIDTDPDTAVTLAREELERFGGLYLEHWQSGMLAKLGISNANSSAGRSDSGSNGGNAELIQAFLGLMHKHRVDYTNGFRGLAEIVESRTEVEACAELFENDPEFHAWVDAWHKRLTADPAKPNERAERMNNLNPLYIPRNHLVEEVLQKAVEEGDFSPLEKFLEILARPYERQAVEERFALPPKPGEQIQNTFCGT